MSESIFIIAKNRLGKRSLGAVVGAAIVILIIFLFLIRGVKGEHSEWVQVNKGDFPVELMETGSIRAVNSSFVRAPHEWRSELQILDMAPEGIIVKKGDFLIQFDTSAYEEQLATAIENLEQEKAELLSVEKQQEMRMSGLEANIQMALYSKEAAEMSLEKLKFESEIRKKEARLGFKKSMLSFELTEQRIKSQKINDEIQHKRAVMRVEQAQRYVNDMEKRIEALTLLAPISGMVVYREIGGHGSPRHKIAIGDKPRPGRALISIPDLSKMEMVAQINEMDVARMKVGQKAVITLDAYVDDIFYGKVTDVAKLVEKKVDSWRRYRRSDSEPLVEVAAFLVTILIDGSDPKLKPGMTAQGKISLETIPDALYVPVESIFELEDSTQVVFTKRNYPEPTPVKVGKRNDRFIIIEEGLRQGDQVSRISPVEKAHPLGWLAEMERRKSERKELLADIDTMNELGIINDSKEQASQTSAEKNEKTPLSPGEPPQASETISKPPGEKTIIINK